ncbi:MAG: SHOCT domain-containing protein, partial [Acidimicrobiales bacterium]
ALQRVINRQLSQMDSGWQPHRAASAAERFSDDRVRAQRREWTPPSGVPHVRRGGSDAGSIPDQLIALDRLHRQGILSDREFADKKAELLRRF